MKRERSVIKGIIQGVGFRPFLYRLAQECKLTGWVCNSSEGVFLELQGPAESLEAFYQKLQQQKPENAVIWTVDTKEIPMQEESGFCILESALSDTMEAIILPDLVACSDCLQEVMTPGNRRYRFPFTNCTQCGPRFSITEKLPYDRVHTTMQDFSMCSECQREYETPDDRRFHAQPNACPLCGPQLTLMDEKGCPLAIKDEALLLACAKVREGAVVALKGIGGFQLIVDAGNASSVQLLRERKQRKEKPFAMMYPSLGLIKNHCKVTPLEEELLQSQQAPIVLLEAKTFPSPNIAPNNPYLGIMLPSSPLHFLLMQELGFPVIATSGNRSDEPICTDENEAITELEGIADYFLVHNRRIAHAIDDSIVRVIGERKMLLRRARGYAPLPIRLTRSLPPALAVGGQLKNTVAAAKESVVYMSQHIGDLENHKANTNFSKEIARLQSLYGIAPEVVLSDCHPDYESAKYAPQLQKPIRQCQHHLAHVYSCMAEQKIVPPLLGVSWDGTGYGLDGTVWGGEFFSLEPDLMPQRIATFRAFPLPLGAKAVMEPRLSAIGLLYEIYGEEVFSMQQLPPLQNLSENEVNNYKKILASGFQTPQCSSVGRLFDGIAALLGLRQKCSFEGQAAMELEFLCKENKPAYSFAIKDGQKTAYFIDWQPMLEEIMQDIQSGAAQEEVAARFHQTLVEIIATIAGIAAHDHVVLTGGAFQNRLLAENTIQTLQERSHRPIWHEEVPPNDGGIALGQLYSLCV